MCEERRRSAGCIEPNCSRIDQPIARHASRTRVHLPEQAGDANAEFGLDACAGEGGLPQVRVHDLKHTFGRRLRAVEVSSEDRQDLLGHRSGQITTHYSAAELTNLIEAANSVCSMNDNTRHAFGCADARGRVVEPRFRSGAVIGAGFQ